ncbi:hypothetical protein DFJ74DRAFT_765173 [Hyaloraphidium curvatum]|nr:hypothetical protein DFJ74DRAFT_765173 [Hyaloraphidium curvatum]
MKISSTKIPKAPQTRRRPRAAVGAALEAVSSPPAAAAPASNVGAAAPATQLAGWVVVGEVVEAVTMLPKNPRPTALHRCLAVEMDAVLAAVGPTQAEAAVSREQAQRIEHAEATGDISVLPVGQDAYEDLTNDYNRRVRQGHPERTSDQVKNKFTALVKSKKPTGDPSCPTPVKMAKRQNRAIEDMYGMADLGGEEDAEYAEDDEEDGGGDGGDDGGAPDEGFGRWSNTVVKIMERSSPLLYCMAHGVPRRGLGRSVVYAITR